MQGPSPNPDPFPRTHNMDAVLIGLIHALAESRVAEAEAKKARVEAEEAIIRHTGFKKTEGQETFGDKGFSVTLKQPITSKVDPVAWRKIRHALPAGDEARKVMREKYDLDTKKARALQKERPEIWVKVSKCVTRKPGKVGVDLNIEE